MDTEEMKKVHHPTEQEVYDLLANLELAGLPSALIVTGLSPEVFKDNQAKENFESLFRAFDDSCEFQYFKSFRRCRVRFADVEKAAQARINCHEVDSGDGSRLRCFFAQVIDTSLASSAYLNLPELEKQFLISPPSSPPVGWEQSREQAPIVPVHPHLQFELASKLAALVQSTEPQELVAANADNPAIIFYPCGDENGESTDEGDLPKIKPKIQKTPRPSVDN